MIDAIRKQVSSLAVACLGDAIWETIALQKLVRGTDGDCRLNVAGEFHAAIHSMTGDLPVGTAKDCPGNRWVGKGV